MFQDRECADWGPDCDDHVLVVAEENGEQIHPHNFSQPFERLIEQAELRRIRLHDLWHTHARLALTAGVPVNVNLRASGKRVARVHAQAAADVTPGMQADDAAQVTAMIDGPLGPFSWQYLPAIRRSSGGRIRTPTPRCASESSSRCAGGPSTGPARR